MNLDGNLLVKVLEERVLKQAAIEMITDNLSLEKIAQYTKMPIEWVENLQQLQTTQPQ